MPRITLTAKSVCVAAYLVTSLSLITLAGGQRRAWAVGTVSGQAGSGAAATGSAADKLKQELEDVGVQKFTSPDYKPGLLRHIVLFRYAANVTEAQKQEVKQRFLALQQLCVRDQKNYIVSIETGAQNSGEGVDQGLEQGFIVTFRSEGDRNYYVGQPVVTDARFYEPAHQAFKDFVGPLLDQSGALVFDYTRE